jgi:hypothetical protein
MSAIALDPLIAEASRRARRRGVMVLGSVAVVVAAAIGTTLGLRSSPGNALGLCATPLSGWKVKTVAFPVAVKPTVVLTNFRFGRMMDLYGLQDRFHWPSGGVTIAVINEGRRNERGLREGTLRLTRADFNGLEGSTQPSGFTQVRSRGVVLYAYAAVGKLTPATIALANGALAGVRTCSA